MKADDVGVRDNKWQEVPLTPDEVSALVSALRDVRDGEAPERSLMLGDGRGRLTVLRRGARVGIMHAEAEH